MSINKPFLAPTPTLAFTGADGAWAGDERFALLDAIDRLGSISAAAKEVGLSYRAAWDAVNALNNLFPKLLVVKQPGGKRGGGALVTAEGRHALAAHHRLSQSLTDMLADFTASLGDDSTVSFSATPWIWSLLMKTSARNTFFGVISNVKSGPINAEVTIRISEETEITAITTNKSALRLGIYPGREAFALIKANIPILMPEEAMVRTSARNRICGEILSVEKGEVNADVVLDIGGGKTLSAIVTDDSVEELDLKPGQRMCALIKASQIIIGIE